MFVQKIGLSVKKKYYCFKVCCKKSFFSNYLLSKKNRFFTLNLILSFFGSFHCSCIQDKTGSEIRYNCSRNPRDLSTHFFFHPVDSEDSHACNPPNYCTLPVFHQNAWRCCCIDGLDVQKDIFELGIDPDFDCLNSLNLSILLIKPSVSGLNLI